MGYIYLYIPKLHLLHNWGYGWDKKFESILSLYGKCNYFSMLRFMLFTGALLASPWGWWVSCPLQSMIYLLLVIVALHEISLYIRPFYWTASLLVLYRWCHVFLRASPISLKCWSNDKFELNNKPFLKYLTIIRQLSVHLLCPEAQIK